LTLALGALILRVDQGAIMKNGLGEDPLTLTTISLCSVLRCIVMTLAFLTIAARAQITPGGGDYTSTVSPTASFGTSARLELPCNTAVRKSQKSDPNAMRKLLVNVQPGVSSWPNHIPQE
jgi:hypothetical protein